MRKILFLIMCIGLIGCQTPTTNIMSPVVHRGSKSIPQFFNFSSAKPVFPTKQGFNWNYQVNLSSVDDQYTVKKGSLYLTTEKVQKTDKKTHLQLRMIDSFSNRYRFPTIDMTADSIHINDVTFIGIGGVNAPGFSTHFLPLPLQPEQRADDGQWISKVKQQETIRVPDGTYKAWKVEVIGTRGTEYTIVGNYWVTPGVGIIKSDVTIPGWYVEMVLESAYIK